MTTSFARAGCLAAMTAVFVAVNRDPGLPLVVVSALACLDRALLAAGILMPQQGVTA